jgi:isoleucyl-tRNA synthetase
VLRYTDEWESYVTRRPLGGLRDDYKTLDLDYMESVMWAFKTLHDKGLVYEGFRVLRTAGRCETRLYEHRDQDGDVYRSRQDPPSTSACGSRSVEPTALRPVWTTTPDAASNLAWRCTPTRLRRRWLGRWQTLVLAGPASAPTPRARGPPVVAQPEGSEPVAGLHPAVRLLRRPPNAHRVLAATT